MKGANEKLQIGEYDFSNCFGRNNGITVSKISICHRIHSDPERTRLKTASRADIKYTSLSEASRKRLSLITVKPVAKSSCAMKRAVYL